MRIFFSVYINPKAFAVTFDKGYFAHVGDAPRILFDLIVFEWYD